MIDEPMVRAGLDLLGPARVRRAMRAFTNYAERRGHDETCFVAETDGTGFCAVWLRMAEQANASEDEVLPPLQAVARAFDTVELDDDGGLRSALYPMVVLWLAEHGEAFEPARLVSGRARAEVDRDPTRAYLLACYKAEEARLARAMRQDQTEC